MRNPIMRPTRRKFILGTGAALVAGVFERGSAQAVTTTAPDIRALLESAGFDPADPNSTLLAIVADLHINQNPNSYKYTNHFDDGLVNELNGLVPAITDLAIAGDLITYLSDAIGVGRNAQGYAWALQEFQVAKAQMTRFRPDMRLFAVPGNHDTDKLETDAETWRTQLSIPPYQKQVLGGVPVFFLNSGHAGGLNPVQQAWFEAETAQIPSDQEILIIAHHPTFFHGAQEGALRKTIADSLPGHQAPVWIVGGHGHSFGERLCADKGRRFIQMEVTAGNPKPTGDGRNPGYILLGLSGGKVACRIFRSLKEAGHGVRAPLSSLPSTRVEWPFEKIQFPAELFVEGFYDRADRLISFAAADLKFHFVFTQHITYRIRPSRFGGKLSSFLLLGQIRSAARPTATCSFSASGTGGPWVSTPITQTSVAQVFTIPIPTEFRNAEFLHVRISTSLPSNQSDMEIVGWGTAASAEDLTGYEKWIATHYRTILPTAKAAPTFRPQGSTLTNLEHFAFNIPLPAGVSESPTQAAQIILPPGPTEPQIVGQPSYSPTFRNASIFRFARRTAASDPLVTYAVEHSPDMIQWIPIDEERLAITPLELGWEEVRFSLPFLPNQQGFFRTRVTALPATADGSAHISSGDLDADGIDDLLQYAFNLNAQEGKLRSYDPARNSDQAGIPILAMGPERMSRIVFPKMREFAAPGVTYGIEQSTDLRQWSKVPAPSISARVLRSDGDWDEVETLIMDSVHPSVFYRVCLETTFPITP
jgi:hypothetical protein